MRIGEMEKEIIDTKAKVFVVSFFLIVIIDLRLFI
jgi:hypothetical protein